MSPITGVRGDPVDLSFCHSLVGYCLSVLSHCQIHVKVLIFIYTKIYLMYRGILTELYQTLLQTVTAAWSCH
jgi:hypothetical protein